MLAEIAIAPKKYSSLPTMQYYLIVSQTEPFVEVYSQNNDKWEFACFTTLEETIPLPQLDATLTMKAIFEGIF
jgi:Uma2 family endonuclease